MMTHHSPWSWLRPHLLGLFACALLLPACATVGGSSDDDDETRSPQPRTEETEGNEPGEEEASPEESGPRTVQGYRIQVLSTEDKDLADQRAAQVEERWGGPVEIAWRAPYYRVRFGAFASRDDAGPRLSAVQQQYPDAFLVPDTVTISN